MPAVGLDPAVSEQRLAKQRAMSVIMCLAAGLLGAGLGGGMAYWYNHDDAPPKITRALPSHGLVILTAEPFANFKLVSSGRRFLAGKTGAEGDITIEDIRPGEYDVEVKAADGRVETRKVAVKSGVPTVIGEDTELFAQ